MSNHSNPEISKHIQSSEELVKKMAHLTDILLQDNNTNFKTITGVELPSAVEARVRKVDISMVYSVDPKVDEYVMGAKSILDAAFKGNESEVIDKSLNLVGDIAKSIIGSGTIQTGIHGDSALINGEYLAVCTSVIEVCEAKEWDTDTNFYVAAYTFVVFQPKKQMLSSRQRFKLMRPASRDLL
ncbi:hypothetical protein QUA35_05475 [Microcoleus sp. N9_B2]|uniref:hypothetical protein n=1 Tax=unclassified Microcoleus TaxID=2642155 RepID=UPI002FD659F1